jgi:hypothetical protein
MRKEERKEGLWPKEFKNPSQVQTRDQRRKESKSM